MKILFSILTTAVLALGGCAGSDGDDPLERVAGTPWQLQHVHKTAVPEGVVVTADFAEGRVTGNGGCNDYSGTCRFEGETVTIGPIGATKKYCDGPAGATEHEYFACLEAVVRWQLLDDGRLQLVRADGETLTFRPSPKAG